MENMERTETALTVQEARELIAGNRQMETLLRGMAEMLRATNERMAALEQQVRLLEKVTPAQAADINRAIRERAKEVCAEYRAKGGEKDAASAIRRAIRVSTGTRSTKDIARCDYAAVMEQARSWDEYQTMKAIRAKEARA